MLRPVHTSDWQLGTRFAHMGRSATRLQILIRTCHPDRYRGVGEPIALK